MELVFSHSIEAKVQNCERFYIAKFPNVQPTEGTVFCYVLEKDFYCLLKAWGTCLQQRRKHPSAKTGVCVYVWGLCICACIF